MRATPSESDRPRDLRRRLDRLDGLPLRPTTVRQVLAAQPDEAGEPLPVAPGPAQITEVDPGWVLALGSGLDPLAAIAERPWWPALSSSATEAIGRLWRHAVAASCAARRLAEEVEDPDPDGLARAGLLHGLGRWALAAVDPDGLAAWLAVSDPIRRRDLERSWVGKDLGSLGRDLAERWGVEPILIDAAWLHDDLGGDLMACAEVPGRLALIQKAYAWAERTPWALSSSAREPGTGDQRVRLLMAEVQVRCGPAFVEADATPHEERLARSNARLRLRNGQLLRDRAAHDRFLQALAASDPAEGPQIWAERAASVWRDEPGVVSARVSWGPSADATEPTDDPLPAPRIVPLIDRGRTLAEVRLGLDQGASTTIDPDRHPTRDAWRAWAVVVADRDRLARRLETVTSALRLAKDRDDQALRLAKLDALAEFAAGAGHELNNPLAVILGRAQLLLARQRDPDAVRSLRAIIGQAQRAHRILRDLMYVARPADPRPRPCQPDEIIRSCLRDLEDEAESRGVRLDCEAREPAPRVWADPDPLRHLAEVFTRNALEATPPGGNVRVSASGDFEHLEWTFQDDGRGISATEATHLFDPFYCGRQAGRGLGLGLPRAARFIARAGGDLDWRSAPGRGTVFRVLLPLSPTPDPSVRP